MDLIRYNSLPRLADWIIDYPTESYVSGGVNPYHHKPLGLDISNVVSGDVIFVKIDLLDSMVPYLCQITKPWHLVTGNGDLDVNSDTIERLDKLPLLKSWCGHNLPKINHKFFQVPIGFQELGPGRPNSPQGPFFPSDIKPIHVVVTPFGQTHGDRNSLRDLLGIGILNLQNRLLYAEYQAVLAASKYSCCPRGNGWDTHRIIESIAWGAIPVVLHSPLDSLYQMLGCVIIDDWQSCLRYDLFPNTEINTDMITWDWWRDKIKLHQESMQ